jgi:hypothetical protein
LLDQDRPAALAAPGGSSYLRPMARSLPTEQEIVAISPSSGGIRPVTIWAATGFGVAVLLGALALWFRYGTAVFFETIASGFSSCF